MIQRTVVLHKPDAVARGLIGRLTAALEDKGLVLVGCKMMRLDDALLADHYSHLSDKPFFPRLVSFMTQLPVVVQCWEGVDVVDVVRSIVGVTNGREAAPGSLRGLYSTSVQANLIHASDSPEGADAELRRFFEAGELFAYDHPLARFLNSDDERCFTHQEATC